MHILKIHGAHGAVEAQAETGERLIDALARAGVSIGAPCGGRCFCGKCTVTVQGDCGAYHEAEKKFLSDAERASGKRLACACGVHGDLTVWPEEVQAAILTDGGAGEGTPLNPSSVVRRAIWSAPSLRDQRSDEERLLDALVDVAEEQADIAMNVLKALPAAMREHDALYVSMFEADGRRRIVSISSEARGHYGVAVDIGTTTLAAYLVDLATGEQLETASALNPQRGHGGDVITRVDYTIANPEGLKTLALLVREQIASMILGMADRRGISAAAIHHVTLVGNTIMMHLLAELTARHIAVLPFIPAYTRTFSAPAPEIGLPFENAMATLGPCVAGYVGADTVAAILACGMQEKDGVSLMIDIGTNGEIALGGKGRMLCCSAAAGPAFEGAHIRHGSGAVRGAIDHVYLSKGEVSITTIGGAAPMSVCGSGLVDAIAAMLWEGILDETGRIDEDEAPEVYSDAICEIDGKPAFILTNEGGGIYICQKDVREVQLAKAAIAAGIEVLMNELNVTFNDIETLYLAGGFGNFIDKRSACAIGLLPKELHDRIVPVGNGAGTGAKKMLLDRETLYKAETLRKRMEYIELSAKEDFQDLFAENMMFEQ